MDSSLLKPPLTPPEHIAGTIHGCLWLLPISGKPDLPGAHVWLRACTSGEPVAPLGELIAALIRLDDVDEENEYPDD